MILQVFWSSETLHYIPAVSSSGSISARLMLLTQTLIAINNVQLLKLDTSQVDDDPNHCTQCSKYLTSFFSNIC